MPCDGAVSFAAQLTDDETLFGSFTLLRYRPHVIICLRSQVQEDRGTGITAEIREAETRAALEILDVGWEQWPYLDSDPSWDGMSATFAAIRKEFDVVFAPAVEVGGHEQHNTLGNIADTIFGDKVVHYLTYVRGWGRSRGKEVEVEPGWVSLKLRALAEYRSQIEEPTTNWWWFNAPIVEYLE